MGFGLVRIDDRLVHGQVMAVWCKTLGTNRIVIADDDVAEDSFLQKVMRLAAPPGVKVEVYSVSDSVGILSAPEAQNPRTTVLVKNPRNAAALVRAGVKIECLNVGGMGARPGRKQLFRNVSASPEEVELLKEIQASGVEVVFRIVPDERGTALSAVIK
ncbi:MAG: PTS sugar transporter subunit IIB [Firmicutes bacterium]|nr:PTS sugar transporter subunit IIB [Bacillota bacterium]